MILDFLRERLHGVATESELPKLGVHLDNNEPRKGRVWTELTTRASQEAPCVEIEQTGKTQGVSRGLKGVYIEEALNKAHHETLRASTVLR